MHVACCDPTDEVEGEKDSLLDTSSSLDDVETSFIGDCVIMHS